MFEWDPFDENYAFGRYWTKAELITLYIIIFAVAVAGCFTFYFTAFKVIAYVSWVPWLIILAGAGITGCVPFGFTCGVPLILVGLTAKLFF